MSEHDGQRFSAEEMELARRGETIVKAASARVEAPHSLREAIERERARSAAPRRPLRRRYLLAGAATAAAAAALVLTLSSDGGGEEPTLAQVDAVAALAPTAAAPAPLGGDPPVLDASVPPIDFPDWQEGLGWTAVGSRQDELDGRAVTTVFYRNPEGARLGYAIIAGPALEQSPGGEEVMREGNSYFVSSAGGRTTVTWEQQGRTCVIVAPSQVPADRLVELAATRDV